MFNKITPYEIAVTAILVAILIFLRNLTAAFMGISFTGAVLIFIASFLSVRVAINAGAILYLITGIYMGFGIWVPFQILGTVIVVAATKFIPKERPYLCVYAFFSSFMYSFVMLFSALPYIPLSGIIAYVIAGLPNDFIYAVTSFIMVFLLYRKNLVELMGKYKHKYLEM